MAEATPAIEPVRRPLEEEMDRAVATLAAAERVALACHVNPDPDAAGSMLGLGLHLAALGKHVVCSWGNQPFTLPRWMGLLEGAELLVPPKEFPAAPAVMVALDTAAPDRLGPLSANAQRAAELIVIDHHRTNPRFGTIVVLDPDAVSTAELVFRLVERMGGMLPDAAAACLYAGLITDSGRFQYEATTPETLRIAAKLRAYVFDHSRLSQGLFEDGSVGALKATAVALDRAELVPEAGLVWTYLTQADVAQAGIPMAEADDLIDVIRTAREADTSCVIRQQRDGRFKVSLRSRGATNVAAIAEAFGGGGHRLAAGYTAPSGLEEAVRQLTAALRSQRGEGR
jgi:bifunctional oligoribonuclease and PAP phosphatase NrnA